MSIVKIKRTSKCKTSESVARFLEKHFKNTEITDIKPLQTEEKKISLWEGEWVVSFANGFDIQLSYSVLDNGTADENTDNEVITIFESLSESNTGEKTTLHDVYFRNGKIMDFVNKIFDEIYEYVKVSHSHERRIQFTKDVINCDWYERHLSNFAGIDGFMQGVSTVSKYTVREDFIKSLLLNNEIVSATKNEKQTTFCGDWTLTLENGLTLDITILSNDTYALMEENRIIEFYKISKGTDSVQMHGHRLYLDKPENAVVAKITDKIKKAMADAMKNEKTPDVLETLENFIEKKR